MATYRFAFTAPGRAADVFGYLARFSNAQEWDPGVVSAKDVEGGPVRVGSRYELLVRVAGRDMVLVYEVTELEPGARVVLQAQNSLVHSRDVIEVRDVGEPGARACRVTYTARLTGRGAGALLGPVLAVGLRRIGDRARRGLVARLAA